MFHPMKPETITRRALERKVERLKALPGMIAGRERMALKDNDPEWQAHWFEDAAKLQAELDAAGGAQ